MGVSETYLLIVAKLLLVFIVICFAFLADRLLKRFIISFVTRLVKQTSFTWDDRLLERKLFGRIAHLAPAIILHASIPVIFPENELIRTLLTRVTFAFIIILGTLVIDSILNVTSDFIASLPFAKNKPIKTYFQVVKIVLYSVVAIILIASLVNKSPWALLSGLGAMTAILMLVFKDSILGFVASVQMAGYDLVRVGDWIEFPKYGADGDVIEISLNVVKIQNWDKTITTVPTYEFMAGSFKNWRGMSDSQGRRIKRAINIDMTSVKFSTPEMIERFKKIELISSYVKQKEEELDAFNRENVKNNESPVNGRRMTNLGTFRAYVQAYLEDNKFIHQGMTLLVRQLAPTEEGLPIEIYCFSKDKAWANYENIQSDIFDHILAILDEFELKVFQNPTGNDFSAIARINCS